jgi:beta-glucosidase
MTENAPYLNPKLPIEARATDLLARMTLEEKVGQMCQYLLPAEKDLFTVPAESVADVDDSTLRYGEESKRSVPDLISRGLIGSILSEPNPERLNAAQRLALSSRLGIPMIFGIDAIHGNALQPGATVFPARPCSRRRSGWLRPGTAIW